MVDFEILRLGGGVLTDVERFVMGPNSDMTLNGDPIHSLNAVDYFGGSVYDHEPYR